MIRLREIFAIALVLLLVGSGIWFFNAGTADNAVGAGGLPLIKADTNPAKLPPEDPGGEIMPNADSTVFSAMGIGNETDPSMDGVKLPEDLSTTPPAGDGDFAGLRTGFAVPAEPETKTESLFEGAIYKETGQSKYFSGLVDEPVVTPEEAEKEQAETKLEQKVAEAQAPAPEPVKVEKVEEKKTETAKAEIKKPDVTPTEIPPQPAPITEAPPVEEETPVALPMVATDEPSAAAQNMEAQEKAAIRPVAKPQPPVAEVKPAEPVALVKPEAAPETQRVSPKPVAEKIVEERPEPQAPKPEDEAFKPATTVSTAKKGYYIQLASSPSGADMMGVWSKLKAKYAVALAGLTPVTQTANVTGRGEFVRLQAGPMTQTEANDRCKALRQVDPKGGCFVLKR